MSVPLSAAVVAAGVGSAAVAGVLLAFSIAVMPALGVQPASAATAVMTRVNVVIVAPVFMVLLFGTAAASVLAAVTAFLEPGTPAVLVAAAAALYVAGCLGVTVAVNVPLNDRLAAAEDVWPEYLTRWTRWNHVRVIAGLGASVLFVVAGVAA